MHNLFDLKEFSRLTSLIMAAGLDPDKWTDVLEMLNRHTEGIRVHMFGHDFTTNTHLGMLSAGYSEYAVETYESYYYAQNLWAAGFLEADPGKSIHSEWMCPRSEIEKTEFYHDWILKDEDIIGGGGALLFKEDKRMFAIGGNIRRKDVDKLEADWLRLIDLIVPHLQQAFEVNRLLGGKNLEMQGMVNVANPDEAAVLTINRHREITFTNALADILLEAGDLIHRANGNRLAFRNQAAEAPMAKALLALSVPDLSIPISFQLASKQGLAPFHCRTARADPALLQNPKLKIFAAMNEPSLLITIVPQKQERDLVPILQQSYGLTQREAEIAIVIADGKSPRQVSEEHGVSIHTVRNQLKSAMAKMDAHRQAELTKKITTLSALI